MQLGEAGRSEQHASSAIGAAAYCRVDYRTAIRQQIESS
uniref:Uncharacterized protein n=1 Tax=Arundo donax TaxID=35708 RepID=A0A0A9GR65_ARUDO